MARLLAGYGASAAARWMVPNGRDIFQCSIGQRLVDVKYVPSFREETRRRTVLTPRFARSCFEPVVAKIPGEPVALQGPEDPAPVGADDETGRIGRRRDTNPSSSYVRLVVWYVQLWPVPQIMRH